MFFYIILSRSLSLSLSLSSNATGLMQRHNRVHMVLRAGVRMLALAHALRSHLKHFRVSKSQVHVVKYIEAKQLFTKTRWATVQSLKAGKKDRYVDGTLPPYHQLMVTIFFSARLKRLLAPRAWNEFDIEVKNGKPFDEQCSKSPNSHQVKL